MLTYLKDEDGNNLAYRDGTPIPDLNKGYGVNHDDPASTVFVKATGPNGQDFGQLPWINEEYADGYIDQQQHFFPDSGTTFTKRHPIRQAGNVAAL